MTIELDTGDASAPRDRHDRRRRVAGIIGAAMLIAAAGGVGFGIGRSLDRDAVATPAAQDTDAPDTGEDSGQSAAPSTDPPAPATAAATEQPATTDSATGDGSAESGYAVGDVPTEVAASGGPGWSMFGDGDVAALLFERTTDAGLTVRAHLGPVWNEEFGSPGDTWQPPGWCFESGQVRLALSGDGVIDVAAVGWYSEPYQGRAVAWVTMGRADGVPHRVVFVQAPAATTLVTATFGDGAVDAVAPQNGVAVLVVPGAPETIEHDDGDYVWLEERPDFEVTFDTGADAVVVDSPEVGTWNDPELAASCSPPPPALPDPGEQPADAVAAEAEIVELMAAMYVEGGLLANLDRIDDMTGVEDAAAAVAEGSFQAEASTAQAIVEELVFTDADTAWFRYRIETSGIDLHDRYGIAVSIDGVWKITRATICQDLSMAGGSCGQDLTTIRPPGAEYGGVPEYGVDEGEYIVSD